MSSFSAQPLLAWAMPNSINLIWSFRWVSVLIIIFTPASFALLIFWSFKSNLLGEESISRIVPVSLANLKIASRSIWYSSLSLIRRPVGWEIISTLGFLIALVTLSVICTRGILRLE